MEGGAKTALGLWASQQMLPAHLDALPALLYFLIIQDKGNALWEIQVPCHQDIHPIFPTKPVHLTDCFQVNEVPTALIATTV